MAVMIGSSMIVRISTAYITPGPEGLVRKKESAKQLVDELKNWPGKGLQHKNGPQAQHHRGNGRQQLHHVGDHQADPGLMKSSVRKIAVPTPSGTASTKASTDVSRVP